MISHASCDHPRTPKARQACRRTRELGAQPPAKPLNERSMSEPLAIASKSTTLRSSDAKRRLRHTLEALDRAIEQRHPRRIRLFTAPATHITGTCVEVGNRVWAGVILLDDDGNEHKFMYSQIFSINFL